MLDPFSSITTRRGWEKEEGEEEREEEERIEIEKKRVIRCWDIITRKKYDHY